MMRLIHQYRRRLAALATTLGVLVACAAPVVGDVAKLQVPPGFALAVYAENVEEARQLAAGPPGLVFVGSRSAGNVYALVDADGDFRAEEVVLIATKLYMPSGLAFRAGTLYVAEVNRLLSFPDIARTFRTRPAPVVVYDRFPDDAHHGWKYLAFGPDGKLYVPIGAPCNICLPRAPHGTIVRLSLDGSEPEIFASGIRNSVGLAWHPRTRDLWFTDNGRDWLGDDKPSCELNRAERPGQHFGYPFVHGQSLRDPEFGAQRPAELDLTPPMVELGAHVAPVGLTFVRGTGWPPAYRDNLLVAEHGSWNRSRKSGYRVVRVVLDPSGRQIEQHEPFITGWLQGESAWGRPSDLIELADGSVLIADDGANRVYRLTYRGN